MRGQIGSYAHMQIWSHSHSRNMKYVILRWGRDGGVNRLKGGGGFADLRGDLAKEGVLFLRWGGLRPQYTLWVGGAFLLAQISEANNIVTQYYY